MQLASKLIHPPGGHVLQAMGVPAMAARGAMRFSFGLTSTEDDVDAVLKALVEIVPALRRTTRAWRTRTDRTASNGSGRNDG